MFDIQNNVQCTGLSWFMYELKTRLLGKGWTVAASSDGTTYSVAGDVITSGERLTTAGTTAGVLTNANAWMRLRHPLSTCELLFSHSTSANSDGWKVSYSKLGFSTGSPSATVAPTATDQVYVVGSSTTFSAMFSNVAVSQCVVAHFILGDVDEDYAWAVTYSGFGQSDINASTWLFDRVTNLEVATDDPTVVFFPVAGSPNTSGLQGTDSWTPDTTLNRSWAFMSTWSVNEQQMRHHVPGAFPANGILDSTFLTGSNPYSGLIDISVLPIWWWRRPQSGASPASTITPFRSNRKGRSRLLRGFVTSFGLSNNTFTVAGQTYFLPRWSNTWSGAPLLLPWASGLRGGW